MPAKVVRVPADLPVRDAAPLAARRLDEGELVVLPTETVYGLAARRDSPEALARLDRAKNRPPDRPYTIHLPDTASLARHVPGAPLLAHRIVAKFWPGPLTIVLDDPAGGGTCGYRVPARVLTQEVLRLAKGPVVMPSANRSHWPPAADAPAAAAAFRAAGDRDQPALILDEGEAELAEPSTVARVDRTGVRILRPGVIGEGALLDAAAFKVLFVCTGNSCRSPMAEGLFRVHAAARLGVAPPALAGAGVQVRSAGTSAPAGAPATPHAREAVARRGADLTGHRAAPVTPALLEWADAVYVMTRAHRTWIENLHPPAAARTRLLDPAGRDIADPLGGDLETYVACAGEIEDALRDAVDRAVRNVRGESEAGQHGEGGSRP